MLRQLRATKLNFEIRGVGLVSRSGVHERMGVYLSRTGTTDEGVGVPRFENKWTWQKQVAARYPKQQEAAHNLQKKTMSKYMNKSIYIYIYIHVDL